jgi:plasminogen activator inhibitor 1 RNA-binding protein
MSGKTKHNMFAAFASDSEEDEEMKIVQAKKQASKEKPKGAKTDDTKEVVGTRRQEEGEYADYDSRRGKPRGRGRGRGRGERGERGAYRGSYRGSYRGNFDGEVRGGYGGRGRYGNFGRGGRYRGPRDTFSNAATREDVTGTSEVHHDENPGYGPSDHRNKRQFDKRGAGPTQRPRKGGDYSDNQKFEHMDAEVAAEQAEKAAEGETPDETKKEEPVEEVHNEEPQEEEEEEVNNFTYQEYLEQKKQNQAALTKLEARKPEEIKEKNIQKYTKEDKSQKTITSKIKTNEAYGIQGIKGDVETGFQPIGDEEEDFGYDIRPRGRGGRGRGGRGRGREGFEHRGGRRGFEHRGGRGQTEGHKKNQGGKRFNATEDEFPAL